MELPRRLGLLDSISVIVGTVIGAGIFWVPNLVARHAGSPGRILAAWRVAAALSFRGLACAELGAIMPSTGGPYVYLRAAYGPTQGGLAPSAHAPQAGYPGDQGRGEDEDRWVQNHHGTKCGRPGVAWLLAL